MVLKACLTDMEKKCLLKCARRGIYCRPLWFGGWVDGSERDCSDRVEVYDASALSVYSKPKVEQKQNELFS
jgi:hypothetical protein